MHNLKKLLPLCFLVKFSVFVSPLLSEDPLDIALDNLLEQVDIGDKMVDTFDEKKEVTEQDQKDFDANPTAEKEQALKEKGDEYDKKIDDIIKKTPDIKPLPKKDAEKTPVEKEEPEKEEPTPKKEKGAVEEKISPSTEEEEKKLIEEEEEKREQGEKQKPKPIEEEKIVIPEGTPDGVSGLPDMEEESEKIPPELEEAYKKMGGKTKDLVQKEPTDKREPQETEETTKEDIQDEPIEKEEKITPEEETPETKKDTTAGGDTTTQETTPEVAPEQQPTYQPQEDQFSKDFYKIFYKKEETTEEGLPVNDSIREFLKTSMQDSWLKNLFFTREKRLYAMKAQTPATTSAGQKITITIDTGGSTQTGTGQGSTQTGRTGQAGTQQEEDAEKTEAVIATPPITRTEFLEKLESTAREIVPTTADNSVADFVKTVLHLPEFLAKDENITPLEVLKAEKYPETLPDITEASIQEKFVSLINTILNSQEFKNRYTSKRFLRKREKQDEFLKLESYLNFYGGNFDSQFKQATESLLGFGKVTDLAALEGVVENLDAMFDRIKESNQVDKKFVFNFFSTMYNILLQIVSTGVASAEGIKTPGDLIDKFAELAEKSAGDKSVFSSLIKESTKTENYANYVRELAKSIRAEIILQKIENFQAYKASKLLGKTVKKQYQKDLLEEKAKMFQKVLDEIEKTYSSEPPDPKIELSDMSAEKLYELILDFYEESKNVPPEKTLNDLIKEIATKAQEIEILKKIDDDVKNNRYEFKQRERKSKLGIVTFKIIKSSAISDAMKNKQTLETITGIIETDYDFERLFEEAKKVDYIPKEGTTYSKFYWMDKVAEGLDKKLTAKQIKSFLDLVISTNNSKFGATKSFRDLDKQVGKKPSSELKKQLLDLSKIYEKLVAKVLKKGHDKEIELADSEKIWPKIEIIGERIGIKKDGTFEEDKLINFKLELELAKKETEIGEKIKVFKNLADKFNFVEADDLSKKDGILLLKAASSLHDELSKTPPPDAQKEEVTNNFSEFLNTLKSKFAALKDDKNYIALQSMIDEAGTGLNFMAEFNAAKGKATLKEKVDAYKKMLDEFEKENSDLLDIYMTKYRPELAKVTSKTKRFEKEIRYLRQPITDQVKDAATDELLKDFIDLMKRLRNLKYKDKPAFEENDQYEFDIRILEAGMYPSTKSKNRDLVQRIKNFSWGLEQILTLIPEDDERKKTMKKAWDHMQSRTGKTDFTGQADDLSSSAAKELMKKEDADLHSALDNLLKEIAKFPEDWREKMDAKTALARGILGEHESGFVFSREYEEARNEKDLTKKIAALDAILKTFEEKPEVLETYMKTYRPQLAKATSKTKRFEKEVRYLRQPITDQVKDAETDKKLEKFLDLMKRLRTLKYKDKPAFEENDQYEFDIRILEAGMYPSTKSKNRDLVQRIKNFSWGLEQILTLIPEDAERKKTMKKAWDHMQSRTGKTDFTGQADDLSNSAAKELGKAKNEELQTALENLFKKIAKFPEDWRKKIDAKTESAKSILDEVKSGFVVMAEMNEAKNQQTLSGKLSKYASIINELITDADKMKIYVEQYRPGLKKSVSSPTIEKQIMDLRKDVVNSINKVTDSNGEEYISLLKTIRGTEKLRSGYEKSIDSTILLFYYYASFKKKTGNDRTTLTRLKNMQTGLESFKNYNPKLNISLEHNSYVKQIMSSLCNTFVGELVKGTQRSALPLISLLNDVPNEWRNDIRKKIYDGFSPLLGSSNILKTGGYRGAVKDFDKYVKNIKSAIDKRDGYIKGTGKTTVSAAITALQAAKDKVSKWNVVSRASYSKKISYLKSGYKKDLAKYIKSAKEANDKALKLKETAQLFKNSWLWSTIQKELKEMDTKYNVLVNATYVSTVHS